MEDHSLTGYLKRRSTEELESMLAYYPSRYANYQHVIPEIYKILTERRAAALHLTKPSS